MAKPHPIHLLQQEVQTLKEQVGQLMPLLEEVRVLRERVEHGSAEEQDHSLVTELAELKEAMKRRDADLDRKREQRCRLETKLDEKEAELDREREQRHSLEAELGREREQQHRLETKLDEKQAELYREREQRHSLEAELGREREQQRRLETKLDEKQAELDREREQRQNLEANIIECNTELHRERDQRCSLEAELNEERQHRERLQEELRQRVEHTSIDQNPQYKDIVSLFRKVEGSVEKTFAAARGGNTAAMRFLIDVGSGIDIKDSSNWTPLVYAASNGHLGTVQLLVDHGANVNAIVILRHSDRTPLLLAAGNGHQDVCRVLLSAGAQVNYVSEIKWTPLHNAAFNGHLSVVELLLQHGADVTLKDCNGETACDLAKRKEHTQVAACLTAAHQ